ncbi:hypothetical protein D3C87_1641440 [compost metagenome]
MVVLTEPATVALVMLIAPSVELTEALNVLPVPTTSIAPTSETSAIVLVGVPIVLLSSVNPSFATTVMLPKIKMLVANASPEPRVI